MRRSKPPVFKSKPIARARSFPRLHWKKKKLLTVLDNRRQWDREFGAQASPALELTTENGLLLIPKYILLLY